MAGDNYTWQVGYKPSTRVVVKGTSHMNDRNDDVTGEIVKVYKARNADVYLYDIVDEHHQLHRSVGHDRLVRMVN